MAVFTDQREGRDCEENQAQKPAARGERLGFARLHATPVTPTLERASQHEEGQGNDRQHDHPARGAPRSWRGRQGVGRVTFSHSPITIAPLPFRVRRRCEECQALQTNCGQAVFDQKAGR